MSKPPEDPTPEGLPRGLEFNRRTFLQGAGMLLQQGAMPSPVVAMITEAAPMAEALLPLPVEEVLGALQVITKTHEHIGKMAYPMHNMTSVLSLRGTLHASIEESLASNATSLLEAARAADRAYEILKRDAAGGGITQLLLEHARRSHENMREAAQVLRDNPDARPEHGTEAYYTKLTEWDFAEFLRQPVHEKSEFNAIHHTYAVRASEELESLPREDEALRKEFLNHFTEEQDLSVAYRAWRLMNGHGGEPVPIHSRHEKKGGIGHSKGGSYLAGIVDDQPFSIRVEERLQGMLKWQVEEAMEEYTTRIAATQEVTAGETSAGEGISVEGISVEGQLARVWGMVQQQLKEVEEKIKALPEKVEPTQELPHAETLESPVLALAPEGTVAQGHPEQGKEETPAK